MDEVAKQNQVVEEELRQLVRLVSHDLKEPLRTISSFLGLLRLHLGDGLDESGRRYLDFALDGSHRMRLILDDLLTYLQVERGPATSVIDMNGALEAAKAALEPTATQVEAQIVAPQLPSAAIDPQRLTVLFRVLLDNALKFRGPAAPRIEISYLDRGDRWQFTVSDNGMGIPEKYLEEIFALTRRLHPRNEYPGHGFGLTIARKIVMAAGGEIWAESSLQHGSKFHFTLPKACA